MTIRVNVKSRVNNASIRREQRNGRDVVIVPSATLPDDVVMNRIKYPANVIEDGFKTLERTPAPLGHPQINGAYVNANDPEAINGFWVGAWNENVRRENGRVFLDKVIDVTRAESTEQGRELLEAINQETPIHTSTGLFLDVNEANEEDYDLVATKMVGDHDCFLLNQEGAATPEQGVGVFVNSNGEKIEVINSELPDDDAMDVAVDIMMDSMERNERKRKWASMKERLANMIREAFSTEAQADGLNVNQDEGNTMPFTDEQRQELAGIVAEQLKANSDAVTEAVETAVKPLKDEVETLKANHKAEEEAAHTEAVQSVVNAKLMDEEEAKGLPTQALNALVKTSKKAAPLAPGMASNSGDDDTEFQTLPE